MMEAMGALADGFAEIEQYNERVGHVAMRKETYESIPSGHRADTFDQAPWGRGLTLWGAEVEFMGEVPAGEVWLTGDEGRKHVVRFR